MTTLVEIPGLGEVEFPDSMSPAEIEAQARQMTAGAQPASQQNAGQSPGTGAAFTRGAVQRLLNNAIGLADMVPNPANLAASALGMPPVVPSPPRPTAEDIAGLTTAALQVPGALVSGDPVNFPGRVEQAQAQQAATSRRFAEQAPVATGAGNVAGDIASLLALRAPVRAPLAAATARSTAPLTNPATLGRALQATTRAVRPALARVAETGAEAAALAAIQDNDPATVGAIAAGVQGGNDLVVGGVKKLLKSPAIAGGIGGAVLTASILSNGFQQLIPGGLDRILPTLEGHSKEAVLALLLGGAGQAALGRFGPKAFTAGKSGPVVSEIANVVRRGALISGINAMAKDFGTVGPVASAFSENPDAFGPKARAQLEAAFNGKADLGKTVDRLMKDPVFAAKIEAAGGRPAVPIRQQIRDAISADSKEATLPHATRVAPALAHALGRNEAKRLGFESKSTSPRAFVQRVFADGDVAAVRGLSAKNRTAALTVNLEALLSRAVRTIDGRRIIDPNAAVDAWRRLPEATRNLYPARTRAGVEKLTELAEAGLSGGVPLLTAVSLMQPDGRFTALLTGKPQTKEKSR